ncbi:MULTISPECIES: GreA/GreB family elongation factor [Vibrio]|uniref:GreA/GreB family elongation factor n=3 Tax=Vibrionaceae TaxID=641 RepID=UPI000210EC0B|nr:MULTISPECIES: GreA/GreB family elongation factor [Vibrio]AEH31798.1 hypothetical protein VAA_00850 [Vibrio anguillarum 775]AGU58727.1 hypothetical protein N175_01050 [Vibrio anguillarum M3]ARV26603.1 transcription elongation factor, GreA/GreB, C-term family protein [Vibrio anguillarum]UJQ41745.1 GreA/GreB family elongation factor [Vibrio anguillarum]CDQ48932.1 Putative uncharacterized protein [Vibrio anguillarum]
MININLFKRWLVFLKSKIITSLFVTYQSPLILLTLFERIEAESLARYSTAERRVNVGDRVSFVDTEKCQPYQIIIVLGERNNPNDGLVSLYSYLGASIFGLREQECFKLYILGKEREYKVVNILPEKSLTCVN